MAVGVEKAPGAPYRRVEEMGIAELEAIRLILRGESVVDWQRLHFRSAEDVDHFLRLNLMDLADPRDEARLRGALAQAVEYLRRAFGYAVAESVANPRDLRELFLLASGMGEPSRYRRIACVVLKCMHIVHHLEARELLFRTPIPEAELARRVDRRVMAEAARMKQLGLPVVEFSGNVKSRPSLVTKLLAKKETLAAQVFDRVRYRVVTERRDQLAPVLWHLTQMLFPFNYVMPGQTRNTLVSFRQLVRRHPRLAELAHELQAPVDAKEPRRLNEFSARHFKVLNFVVDLPVRVDDLLPPSSGPLVDQLGRVVFSLVEFQMMDAATARANEQGAGSHDRYKKRQLKTVLRRLSRGLVVPKKKKLRAEEVP